MKKLFTIIVCSISFLVLSACVSKKKLILPEHETVSVISLKKKISEEVKTINKREEISKLIEGYRNSPNPQLLRVSMINRQMIKITSLSNSLIRMKKMIV